MSSVVNVDIQAQTAQPRKELQDFGKFLGNIAKVWENVMGGKGSRQASSNLQQLSKGVDQLGKAAEKANLRLQSINTTLGQVTAQRKALEGTTGSVLLKDKDIYKSLADQEKSLTRQQRTWTTIAAIRGRMAANAPGGGNGSGSGGRGGSFFTRMSGSLFGRATSGLTGAGASLVGSGGAGAMTEALGPILGTVALAALGTGAVGFNAAKKQDETLVNFLPRMRPGQMGSTNVFGLAARLRGIGRPLGYNAEESLQTAQSMSEGGSQIGRGLERDTKASMQFSRMFGLDPSGAASMNATAERMGGFKAGDAKKFASMLATEIARTGLGPRAQEVQEATLMLMNQQMQSNPRANAAPLMALQTILNKTGVPAFQGTAGASFISQLNQGITNPNSEGTEALLMQAAQKAGVHTLFGFEMFKGQGLNNAKTLPSILKTIRESSHNPQEAQMVLSQAFNLPLPKVHALFQATHGFQDLSSGAIKSAMKGLQGGEGFLDKGAQKATDAFSSLDIKQAQILVHEGTLLIGEDLLRRGGNIAKASRHAAAMPAGSPQRRLAEAAATADALSVAFGAAPGTPGYKAIHSLTKMGATVQNNMGKIPDYNGDLHHIVISPSGATNLPSQDLVKGARQFLGTPYAWGGVDPATGLDCSGSMQQIFRKFGVNLPRLAHNQAQIGQRVGKGGLQPGDLMFFNTGQGADHHVGMYAGNGKVIHESSSAGRMVEVPFNGWLANHFSHGQRITVEVTVNHPAFKAHIKEAVQEHHQETTRSKVNTHNKRR